MPAARLLLVATLLALFAACSAEPTPPASAAPASIVGKWDSVIDVERIVRKTFQHMKPTATEEEIGAAVKERSEQIRAQRNIPTQTFRADGTGEMFGLIFDHEVTSQFTWKLIEATAERIVIDTRTEAGVESRMTFLVESPDVLVYADKPMKGQKIVRVK